jgi:hypothetical protein
MLDFVLHSTVMLVAVVSKFFYNTSHWFVDYLHIAQHVVFFIFPFELYHFLFVSKAEVIIGIILQREQVSVNNLYMCPTWCHLL